jgi:hypothetical protein
MMFGMRLPPERPVSTDAPWHPETLHHTAPTDKTDTTDATEVTEVTDNPEGTDGPEGTANNGEHGPHGGRRMARTTPEATDQSRQV